MNAHHDVGGTTEGTAIPREQHAFHPWELRVDALMMVLTNANRPGGPYITVDELRRGIESLTADDYRSLGYYEKWLSSIAAQMVERGIVSQAALDARLAQLEAEHAEEHHETPAASGQRT